MQLVRGLYNLPPDPAPSAVTIGNFDGVHSGHRAIINQLSQKAAERGLQSVVVLFEPQPAEYFSGLDSPARLTRWRDKLTRIKEQEIDRILLLKFDQSLAHLSAEDFICDILIDKLNTKYLLVGDDFRFGRHRLGDFELLSEAAVRYGFELESLDSILHLDHRVSSTRIREFLADGDFEKAALLLGRPFRMSGRVVHGDKIGRDIGYPTINIPVRRVNPPLSGIYAVQVYGIEDDTALDGVASIGCRPTVNGEKCLLEVHLFDWAGDCYGRRVEVEFVKYLRPEEKFDSLASMTQQIERDEAWAREVLRNE